MAWSLGFSGKESIIKDVSHRIMLEIDISDLDSDRVLDKYTRLSVDYFLHLSVVSSEPIAHENKGRFFNRIRMLEQINDDCQGDDPNDAKLYYSLHLPEPSFETMEILLSITFQFDLWVINKVHSRDTLLASLVQTHAHLQSQDEPSAVRLAMGGVAQHDDVDWLLLKLPPNVARIVYLPSVDFPDLRLRTVDLVQSRGLNAVLRFDSEQLQRVVDHELCGSLAAKYGVAADTFLLKSVLQCGPLVSLPLSLDEHHLLRAAARLVHPFVHRKLFASAVKVLSLQVEAADLALVAAASEEQEALSDTLWAPFATDVTPPLTLSYRAN